jgi:hypothetical protein
MGFLASDPENGDWVIPAESEDSQDYLCPHCDSIVRVRPHKETESYIVRHFFHLNDSLACPGESDIHKMAKQAVKSILTELFSEKIKEGDVSAIDTEIRLLANQEAREKKADAGVIFTEECEPWGRGLLVEIQHKNKSKNIKSTTLNYLTRGYSVLWLSSSMFTEREQLNKMEFVDLIEGTDPRLGENPSAGFPSIVFYDDQEIRRIFHNQKQMSESKTIHHSQPEDAEAYREKKKQLLKKRQRFRPKRRSKERIHGSKITYRGLLFCDMKGCTQKPRYFDREYRDGATVYFRRCKKHKKITSKQIDHRFSLR